LYGIWREDKPSTNLIYRADEARGIGTATMHRLKLTEAELLLFHHGALPLREILPLLHEEFSYSPPVGSPRPADRALSLGLAETPRAAIERAPELDL
jgi:hypothetical protein